MFSKTCTDCMYFDSAARAHGARGQSSKCKENLLWNSNIFMNFSAWSHGNSYIFTRWLIRTNLYDLTRTICMTTLNCTYFTSCTIRMNLYEWPTPNPTPKPNHHWGFRQIVQNRRVRSYKFVRISHLVKYVRIGHEIALEFLQGMDVTIWNVRQTSSQILNENHL